MEILKEPEIKAAAIDWLDRKGVLDQSTLVNELVVASSERRADLAIINGHLHAYEIKSDADSLSRLEGQVRTYLKHFDKVTLICTKKFTTAAIEKLPKEVEIIEIERKLSNKYKLTTKRRGRKVKICEPEGFLSFVDKRSIIKLLRSNGVACPMSVTRSESYMLAEKLKSDSWRNWTIEYLKRKYFESHSRFMENKKTPTEAEDLISLRKYKRNSYPNDLATGPKAPDIETNTSFQSKGIDITTRLSRHGFIPKNTIKIIPKKARG